MKTNTIVFFAANQDPVGEDDFNKVTPFDSLLATDDRETFGLRLNGSFSLSGQKVSYIAEYAKQDLKTENGDDFSMPYYFIEAATKIDGTAIKLGHEVLGSDDGNKGFGTPLGTVHLFNGWADMFVLGTPAAPGTPDAGLTDTYLLATGKMGPGKITLAYHQYSDAISNGIGDQGMLMRPILASRAVLSQMARIQKRKSLTTISQSPTGKVECIVNCLFLPFYKWQLRK